MLHELEECSICSEPLDGANRKFGLLENCDHVFCFDCICDWKNKYGHSPEGQVSCPVCRVESSFIAKSYRFKKGETKEIVIKRAKERMKETDCKLFDKGKGVCKYGDNCRNRH